MTEGLAPGLGFLVVDLDDLGVWLLLSHSYNYNYVLGEKSSKIGYYFHYLEGIKLNPSYNFLGIWVMSNPTWSAKAVNSGISICSSELPPLVVRQRFTIWGMLSKSTSLVLPP